MKLTLKIVLLGNDSFLFGSFFAVANAGLIAVTSAVASALALAVVAVILAVALVAIAFAVAAAGVAVQQFTGPCNDTVTIGGNNIDDAGNSSQSQNDLGNYLKSFHDKTLQFLYGFYNQYNQSGGKMQHLFLNYT
jgi:hypothetical protein